MKFARPVSIVGLIMVLVSMLFVGCIGPRKKSPAPTTPPPAEASYWKGAGVAGAPKIVISLSLQRAFFYRDDTLVGESKISTGKKGFETPPGAYRVTQKDKDHVSNLYGEFIDEFSGEIVKRDVDVSKENPPEGTLFQGAKMPFFMRFYKGYGMHAGRVPNWRASHGCVRLPRFMAEHFFNNADIGTPLIVEE